MGKFLTRYRITEQSYNELRIKVLTGKYVQAVKDFRDMADLSLSEARSVILSEFKLEYKLSSDMTIYACINRIEQFEGISNLPISGDIGVVLEFARNQLYLGLRNDSNI